MGPRAPLRKPLPGTEGVRRVTAKRALYALSRNPAWRESAPGARTARENGLRHAKNRPRSALLDSFTTCESHIRAARTAVGEAARKMRFATSVARTARRGARVAASSKTEVTAHGGAEPRFSARAGRGARSGERALAAPKQRWSTNFVRRSRVLASEAASRASVVLRRRRCCAARSARANEGFVRRAEPDALGAGRRTAAIRAAGRRATPRRRKRARTRWRGRLRAEEREISGARPPHVDAGRARVDTLRPKVGPRALERTWRAVQHGDFDGACGVGAARPTTHVHTLAAGAARGEL